MKLTPVQKRIIKALKAGQTVWSYGKSGFILDELDRTVIRTSTLNKLKEAGLIEEDLNRGCYRSSGSSDIHYKLKYGNPTQENSIAL